MALDNVKSILRTYSAPSSFKLLLMAASFSRPQYRGVCQMLLKPFVRDGAVSLRYRCYGRWMTCFVRMRELKAIYAAFWSSAFRIRMTWIVASNPILSWMVAEILACLRAVPLPWSLRPVMA